MGIVFSRSFFSFSCEIEEIINGCLLKVKGQYENVHLVFVNVYAPTNGMDRIAVLSGLCDTIRNCSSDEYLFLGGYFNCTENPKLDRNYQKPNPVSSGRFRLKHMSCQICGGFFIKAATLTQWASPIISCSVFI